MIILGKGEVFLKPIGLTFKDGQDNNIRLPKVAIGVFSKVLFNEIINKFDCKEIGMIRNVNFEKKVYILNYKNQLFTFFMAGVGGPSISRDIEDLHVQGVEKIVIFGNCGVLDSTIKNCTIIIPNLAYREEGTSYHYIEESDTIEINPKYKNEFIEILNNNNYEYTIGSTWSTDAFYRETKDKIEYFKKLNVKSVEMEASTIAAVCKYLGIDYFTFYYAGDNLDSVKWEERSLYEMTDLDTKKMLQF